MPDPDVNPKEVAAMLGGKPTASNDDLIPLELPPEIAKFATAASGVEGEWGTKGAEGVEEPLPPAEAPRQTLPEDPFLSPDAVSVSQLSTWGLGGNLKDIVVTDMDKAVFFKAAINDEETAVLFDIDISGFDYPVKVRSLHNYEEMVLHEALRRDQGGRELRDGKFEFQKRIHDVAGYITFYQYYHAYLRVLEHKGKPRSAPELQGKYSELDKYVEQMRTDAIDWGLAVPGPLWTILLQAISIHSAKLKVCRENLLNRDFWLPAGSV
jgi:hypothetical protein